MKVKATVPRLTEYPIIYVHERRDSNGNDQSKVVAILRGFTGNVKESSILSKLGFVCVGKRKGDLVYEQPLGPGLGFETLKRLDLACERIEGLCFVAPDGTSYRLLNLPFAAGKTKAGYVLYRNGRCEYIEAETQQTLNF